MLYQVIPDGRVDLFMETCGMECDTVAILGVEVVVYWEFRLLVWLRL